MPRTAVSRSRSPTAATTAPSRGGPRLASRARMIYGRWAVLATLLGACAAHEASPLDATAPADEGPPLDTAPEEAAGPDVNGPVDRQPMPPGDAALTAPR